MSSWVSKAKRDLGEEKPNWKNNAYNKGAGKRAMINKMIEDQKSREDPDDGFLLFDLGDVVKKVYKWRAAMPKVTPFFAVKCNPDVTVIRILDEMNCGFDCASKGEVQLLREVVGVDPNRIINANTWKQTSHLAYANSVQVKMMTFDSAEELRKVAKIHPGAELVLRLSIYDPSADFPFGIKFGSTLKNAKNCLLPLAHELKLNVIGVSFHIGSGSSNPNIFVDALQQARKVFNWGVDYGYKMYLVDVGGGFPGKKNGIPPPKGGDVPFEEFADAVNRGLAEHFPEKKFPNLRAIAEPGRYFNESAGTIVVNIYGKRKKTHNLDEMTEESPRFEGRKLHGFDYFVNNGIFGSFARNLIDYGEVPAFPLSEDAQKGKYLPTTVYGDTCAEMDYCNKETHLPECNVGDWLYYEDIGAYHSMNSGTFNGFKPPNKFYYALPFSMVSIMENLENEDSRPEGSPWEARVKKSRGAKKYISKLEQLAIDYSLNDVD